MIADIAFMQRIPDIIEALVAQQWVLVDDFLSINEVRALRAEGAARHAGGDFHVARIGRAGTMQRQETIRSDSVLWLNPQSTSPAELAYWARMELLQAALNEALFLSIREGEFHYAHYAPGAFYKRHIDRFRDDDARVVSVVCYLNEGWQARDGGQLRLWLDLDGKGEFEDIEPKAGRLVLFLSDRFWHEVLPALRARWSVTGWLRRAAH